MPVWSETLTEALAELWQRQAEGFLSPASSRVLHTCTAPRRGPIPYLRDRALVLGARPEADKQEDYGLPQPLAMDRTFIWVAELVPKSKLVILLLLYILYRFVPCGGGCGRVAVLAMLCAYACYFLNVSVDAFT